MTQEQLAAFTKMSSNTRLESLGIEIKKVEEGYMEGKMPVDHRTHQPYGLLHGGASASLAETLASFGSHLAIDNERFGAVGVQLNCNHLRSKSEGTVIGKAQLIKNGRKLHVWRIDIEDEQGKLIATCGLTVMIIDKSTLSGRK